MSNKPTHPRRIKLPHAVIIRSPGLLPMLYKVSELAQELDVSPQAIRKWIKAGLPSQRDNRGHLWINGQILAKWVTVQRRSRRQERLKTDEAYCVRCRKPVALSNPQREIYGRLVILCSHCPLCGCQVYRGVKNG